MTLVESLTIQEREAIGELQTRMKNSLSPDMQGDNLLFYRFLKARDFDIGKAESMLRKHISWRKAHQIDTILHDFKPSGAFTNYIQGTRIGEDKEGSSVRYIPAGNLYVDDIVKSFKTNEYIKHWVYLGEKEIAHLKEINIKTGRNSWNLTLILDLDNLQLANVIHPACITYFLQFAETYQDNYPERLKTLYVINAPSFYVLLYSIVKKVLAQQVIRKIQVYGRSGWKEEFLKVIDADVLPAFLGGNKTDPDSNPLCKTFMCFGGKIEPKYFLSEEDRSFKDKSRVRQVTVLPGKRCEILVEIKNCGSVIQWEYIVKNKDIGFSLHLKKSEGEFEEIIPVWRFKTSDGTQTGSLKCQKIGTYVTIFDNTFSWMNTKEVSYCITVKNPEE